jgi:hypothetical protein
MTTQAPSTFTMQQPGTPRPGTIPRAYTVNGPPKKRCGLLAIRPDTQHDVTIGGRRQKVTAKDRRAFPSASGKFFCMHPLCRDRFFDTEDALRKAHDPQPQLEAREEVHPFGFWSNDAVGRFDPSCPACAKASADATRIVRAKDKDAADVLTTCAEHAGGAIGLLTPTDPNIPLA